MKKYITIEELERQVKSNRPQRVVQLERAKFYVGKHPNAVLIEVPDERSGERFGNAGCRIGQCVKIGGARQPRWYQLWVSWAECDVLDATKAD